MDEVATWKAPRLRSIQVLFVMGLVTGTIAVGVPQWTIPVLQVGDGAVTGLVKVQLCPPILIAKEAVPEDAGVPVIV